MRIFTFGFSLLISALLLGCVEIEQTPSVTPSNLPAEVEGATWQQLPVRYCVMDSGGFADYENVVKNTELAFAAWGVETVNEGACDQELERGNRVNQVGWGAPPPDALGAVHLASYTALLYRTCTGPCPGGEGTLIIEADIYLNPDVPRRLQSQECCWRP